MCSSSRILKFLFLLLAAGYLCWAEPAAASTPVEAMVYYTQTASSNPSTCNSVATYDASGTGATQLVALASGQTIYICGYTIFSPGGVANAQLVYGTGSNCATGQTGLTPPYELSTQKPIIDGRPYVHGLQTAASKALCLVVTSNGYLHYRIITIDHTKVQGGLNGYSYMRPITIDHTKVGTVNNTDQSNFPVLISGTYNGSGGTFDARTVANGGLIQNTVTLNSQTVPADLLFTSDSGCRTKLNWEVASYTASTGALEVWVQVPTVSHSSDTVIYMCYDNSSISTYQGNATSTWDANYKGVYHLPDGTTLSVNDSSASGANGTTHGSPTATAGQIDGAVNLVAASSQYISMTNSVASGNSITVSGWIKTTSPSNYDVIMDARQNGSAAGCVLFLDHAASNHSAWYCNNTGQQDGSVNLADGNWHYLVGTLSGGTSQISYVDGVAVTSGTVSSFNGFTAGTSLIGAAENGGSTPTTFTDGAVDEVRISNIARSADWIKTEYNNQSSPSTFYTVGAQQ